MISTDYINLFCDAKDGLKMFLLGAHGSGSVGTQTISVVRVLWSSLPKKFCTIPLKQKT